MTEKQELSLVFLILCSAGFVSYIYCLIRDRLFTEEVVEGFVLLISLVVFFIIYMNMIRIDLAEMTVGQEQTLAFMVMFSSCCVTGIYSLIRGKYTI